MVPISQSFMTRNDCYISGRTITPKGLMLHSTATPGVMAWDWFPRWNKSFKKREISRQVCVHAFVDDSEVVQYLPWNHRGWHAGGWANNSYIGVEMCEPKNWRTDKIYFEKVYKNAVELFAMLCTKYGLTEKDIIDHAEGHKLGLASNHADIGHWFPLFGKNMNTFREDVRIQLLPQKPPEVDEDKHWSKYYSDNLKRLGIMEGYADGTFRPEQAMTRAEVASTIDKLLTKYAKHSY